jgi:pimeloyl-ACP methyl ester carboxylesterase
MPTATINGFKHYYEDMGSGEVLVMLHGANGSSRTLEEHFPELSASFRVIAPDMRSMGQSEHVESLTSPSAWVDDLASLLDHLGIQQTHVYGTSLGSRVAMRFAMEHPERTRSVIVTAPHTYLTEELNSGMNRADGDGDRLSAEEQARMQRLHGDDWQNAYRNYYNIRNKPDLQKYYNLSVTNPIGQVIGEYSDPVNRIKCPILVVQGDDISRGRGTYDHAIELKYEMPDQVRLAIVPMFEPTGYPPRLPGDIFRSYVKQFIAYVGKKQGVAAGAS